MRLYQRNYFVTILFILFVQNITLLYFQNSIVFTLAQNLFFFLGCNKPRCVDDGRQQRSALSDYCISIREQNAEERKQCIPEQAAWISRIVFWISRRFAKQNGYWFLRFSPPPSSLNISPPLSGQREKARPSRIRFFPQPLFANREEWHSLMRRNNSDASMCFHVGEP